MDFATTRLALQFPNVTPVHRLGNALPTDRCCGVHIPHNRSETGSGQSLEAGSTADCRDEMSKCCPVLPTLRIEREAPLLASGDLTVSRGGVVSHDHPVAVPNHF